ncbi:hypothetical protein KBI52_29085 [Microvirga sp. HBU67558]|uniref:hypothetical protein n=1 Tax=Microvirga TaxID=186650 RepID=UPI001B38A5E9|nr:MULTISPECIES: hypothetical protein [unclassified Microvirga]MBQ0824257.1 hypothetical protein [Microvirga sp. HBU67558]
MARDRKSRANNNTGTVKGVLKIGPTHAAGLHRLVGMNADIRQGEPFDRMSLDFELTCGVAPLRISGRDFDMALRTCFVSMSRENCTTQVGTHYEHWLGTGDFKVVTTGVSRLERGREAGVSAGAEADSQKGLARVFGSFRFGFNRKRNHTNESTVRQDARVELVVTSGQDRWRVGDLTRGDPRRQDGILSGAYFQEARSEDGDPKPLCLITRTDPAETVRVNLQVSASFGSLSITRDGSPADETDQTGARTLLRRRAKASIAQHKQAENDLRARVAGLVVAKGLRDAQIQAGLTVAENEFLIAQQTILVPNEDHKETHD